MDIKIFSGAGVEGLNSNNNTRVYFYSFSSTETFWFNAFLSNFNDSYKSNWTPQEIYGKMDPIATFKNTTRSISFSLDIPSFSVDEAIRNMHYVDVLISSLYPVYRVEKEMGTNILSSPPLFRVKFANFIRERTAPLNASQNYTVGDGLICYFNGFDFKPDTEAGFFDHVVTANSQKKTTLLPKLIKADFSINIIHQTPLGYKIEVNQEGKAGDITDRLGTEYNRYNHIDKDIYSGISNNYTKEPNQNTGNVASNDGKKPTITTIK